MTDSVSDELVEMALKIYWQRDIRVGGHPDYMRDALNAIAPRLRAEGMREAAEIGKEKLINNYYEGDSPYELMNAILARADALDPPGKP